MARNSYLIVAKDLLADKSVSLTARLLFALLLDYRNSRTGQCNPWEATLATKLGVSESSIFRAMKELKKAGRIEVKRTVRGNWYAFPTRQIDGTNPSTCMLPSRQIDGSAAAGPLYEPSLRTNGAGAPGSLQKANPSNAAATPRKPVRSAALENYYEQERRKSGK